MRHLMAHTAGLPGWVGADRGGRPLRLGEGHLPARRPGPAVGARHRRPATTPSRRATWSARSSAASPAAPRSASSSPRRSPARSAPTSTSAPDPSTTTASPWSSLPTQTFAGRPERLDPDSVLRRSPVATRPRRAVVVERGVAAGRDPRRRRPRQRPLGRPGAVGAVPRRRGRRHPPAVPGRMRGRLRAADQRHRPRPPGPAHLRHGLRHQLARDADRPERRAPASGAAGAARS